MLRELAAPGSDIRAIAFSPDGTRMAAAGRAGMVRIWDARSTAGRWPTCRSRAADLRPGYSPDGKLLAAAGQQRIVRLLDAASGKPLADLPERPGEVLALCFCGPRTLASAGSGNVIHLWDLSTGQEQCRLVGHTGSITTLAFDGRTETLVSGSYDTTVRLWDLNSHETGKGNAAMTGLGLGLGSWRQDLSRRDPRPRRIDTEVDVGLLRKTHRKHSCSPAAPSSVAARQRPARASAASSRWSRGSYLSATVPALNVGATYYQPHDGNDSVGSLLYISWNGGAHPRN